MGITFKQQMIDFAGVEVQSCICMPDELFRGGLGKNVPKCLWMLFRQHSSRARYQFITGKTMNKRLHALELPDYLNKLANFLTIFFVVAFCFICFLDGTNDSLA